LLLPQVLCATASEAAAGACDGLSHIALMPGSTEPVDVASAMSAASPLWKRFEGTLDARELDAGRIVLDVALPSGASVAFDSSVPADRAFFEELALLAMAADLVAARPGDRERLVDAARPALAAMHVATLARLKASSPDRFEAAATLLDSAVAEIRRAWEDARPGETVWTAVLRAPSAGALAGSRRRLLSTEAEEASPPQRRRLAAAPLTQQEMALFGSISETWQLQFWTFVGLTAVVYWSTYALYFVSYGPDDSGLFSKFKPDGASMDDM
jgi:hypothetical protein